MGKSLQDQFLQLGLVNKGQASKAKKKKHLQKKKSKQDSEVVETLGEAKKKNKAKKDYSKLLNQQKNEQQKLQQLNLQVEQLIATHALPDSAGDVAYKFTYQNKIRKIYIKQEIIDQLSSGKAAIVKSKQGFELVPADTGIKIGNIKEDCLILLHQKSQQAENDDLYAEFEVPDDLIW